MKFGKWGHGEGQIKGFTVDEIHYTVSNKQLLDKIKEFLKEHRHQGGATE